MVTGTPGFVCRDGQGADVDPTTPIGGLHHHPERLVRAQLRGHLANGTLTVTRRPCRSRPIPPAAGYGATNPVFTANLAGFRNTDSTNVVGGQAALSALAGPASPVGAYDIVTARAA